MAKISLTKENIEELLRAFDHFFPENTVYVADEPFYSGDFNWNDRSAFVKNIKSLTGVKIVIKADKTVDRSSVKKAQEVLADLGNEPEKVEENLPDKGKREAMEIEREKREKAIQESAENAKKQVEIAIKRQEELHKNLQSKKIYRKVSVPDAKDLSIEKQPTIDALKEAADSNPGLLTRQLAAEIETRIKGAVPDGADEEAVKALSTQAAMRVVQNLQGKSFAVEAVTANNLAKDSAFIAQVEPTYAELLTDSATNVGTTGLIEYQIDRKIVSSAFGEDFASNFLGPRDIDNVKVEFSQSPAAGYEPFEISEISGGQLEFLNRQDFVFDSIGSNASAEIKSVFLRQVGTWIESKIPETGVVSELYDSSVVQAALSYYGLGEPIAWEGTTFFGRLAIEFGYGPTFGWAGQITGIDFGVSQAAAGVTAEVGAEAASGALVSTGMTAATVETAAIGTGVAATEGAAVVGGVTAGAASAAAGAATGAAATAATGAAVAGGVAATETAVIATSAAAAPVTGGISLIVGAVVGLVTAVVGPKVVGWIKDHAKQIGLFTVGITGGMFGLLIGGLTGAVAGAAAFTALAMYMNGGLAGLGTGMSSIASTVYGTFSAIWASFLAGIGVPFVSFLIGFPVVVTLILLIVNTGAYVVPPDLSSLLNSDNPYIQVTKEASPTGPFENTDLPVTITYTVTVAAKTSTLTNVRFKNECQIITSGAGGTCPAETPAAPASISPGAPFTFTYEETYSGTKYQDSIVTDTFSVTANSVEETGIETSGGASISIGEPPTGCLSINQAEWPSTAYANIVAARSTLLAEFSSYVSKVCLSYPDLPLKYNPGGNGNYWGWNRGTYVDFFALGVKSQADALYTLAHELGHSLAWGSKTAFIYSSYLSYPGIRSEAPYCFYSNTSSWNEGESMPEAIALHVIDPRCGSVQQKWPIHYQFLMKYVFN